MSPGDLTCLWQGLEKHVLIFSSYSNKSAPEIMMPVVLLFNQPVLRPASLDWFWLSIWRFFLFFFHVLGWGSVSSLAPNLSSTEWCCTSRPLRCTPALSHRWHTLPNCTPAALSQGHQGWTPGSGWFPPCHGLTVYCRATVPVKIKAISAYLKGIFHICWRVVWETYW